MKMESLSKSQIIGKIMWAFDHEENLDAKYIHKKNGKVVSIKLEIEERPSFIDKDGVKWVRE